jgi:hypothetical protein
LENIAYRGTSQYLLKLIGDKTKNDWMLGPMACTGETKNRFGNIMTLWRCDCDEMTILKWILDK